MIWKEKEKSRIRPVQMDNLWGLLGIRRMDKITNSRIRQCCGVMNVVDEKIDEGVLLMVGHVDMIENNRIAKKVYVGVCW